MNRLSAGRVPARASLRRCHTAVGEVFRDKRSFSEADVQTFTSLTGDANPIHLRLSESGTDDKPIVPGILCASVFPAIIGSRFPGALYLSQTLKFRHPVVVGTKLDAEMEVVLKSGRRVLFSTRCLDPSKKVVLDGEALALLASTCKPNST